MTFVRTGTNAPVYRYSSAGARAGQAIVSANAWAGASTSTVPCGSLGGALNLSDVNFKDRSVTATEIKKPEARVNGVEPFVVSAPNGKSPWHYANHVRPRVAKKDPLHAMGSLATIDFVLDFVGIEVIRLPRL